MRINKLLNYDDLLGSLHHRSSALTENVAIFNKATRVNSSRISTQSATKRP